MQTLSSSLKTLLLRGLCSIAAFILATVMLCGVGVVTSASTAAADTYTYTVTVNAGREGVLNPNGIAVPSHATISGDSQHIKITGLNYGDRISFLGNIATAADGSDYYVRGVRFGGRDGNTSLAELSFEVTEDRDYVVAFARANDLVPYTVQYVTAAGEPLYEEQVYYGNVGDKPVVACLYFDGYQPRAYNITKTLDADPQQNVLTFVYDEIVLPELVAPEPEPGPESAPETPPAPGSEDVVSADEPFAEGNTAEMAGGNGAIQPGDAPGSAGGEGVVVPENEAGQNGTNVLSEVTGNNGENATVLTTNNGGGNPAPAAPSSSTAADNTADELLDSVDNNGNAVDAISATGATPASEEETIADNTNPLASPEQLADLDVIEDDPNPLAMFGSAIPMAGSHNKGFSPWVYGLGGAGIVLVIVLLAWFVYDRRSRRAFAQSSYAAPTDALREESNDDAETFF